MKENHKHIPKGWETTEFGKLIKDEKKSNLKVSDASNFGNFPFFTSGESVLKHDIKQIEGENFFIATGGLANIKFYNGEAAYSTDTYVVKTVENVDSKFLYYNLLNILYYINANYFQGSGLKHLQKKELKQHTFKLPAHKNEQTQIADILSKVDEAIGDTEQLIAKYTRIKTGLMQDLLTKGIDNEGNIRSEETHKFKDSPLGRIPVEWEVESLMNVCDNIVDCPHDTPNYISDGILVARTQNIKNGKYLIATSSYVSNTDYNDRITRLTPKTGDVIFTREAPIGEAFVIPEKMKICLGQRVMLFRTNKKYLIPAYLIELIYSEKIKILFDSIIGGTTVSHLNVKDVKKLQLVIPPIEEQLSILKCLSKNKALLNSFSANLKKLKSKKTALMQDLLSGKVRVTDLIK